MPSMYPMQSAYSIAFSNSLSLTLPSHIHKSSSVRLSVAEAAAATRAITI